MFYISAIKNTAPAELKTELQKEVYKALDKLQIPYDRVETEEAITMEDCILINEKLKMKMVKTLFLCNRQKTDFYLFITTADKPFNSKELSSKLNISRLSFAPIELFEEILGTKIGAATVFSVMLDVNKNIKLIFDKNVINEEFYGCSDGTTTGYLKIKTEYILKDFLKYFQYPAKIIEF